MNDSQKIKLLETISERHPNTRIGNALWQVKRAERKEELRKPSEPQLPHPLAVVKHIRRWTGRA